MAKLVDRDGKIYVVDNTDVIVGVIEDAGSKTTYTVVAPATTTVTAPATTRAALSSPSLTWGFSTQTQLNALVDTVNQLVLDVQRVKVAL